MRPAVYICAPYAAETAPLRAWNVQRATALARLAISEGKAPILVHPTIAPLFGEVETPVTRAIGLSCDEALASLVGRTTNGELWALLRTDRTPSQGMITEYVAWQRARSLSPVRDFDIPRTGLRSATWEGWRQAARCAGLSTLWAFLEDPPAHIDLDVWMTRLRRAASAA